MKKAFAIVLFLVLVPVANAQLGPKSPIFVTCTLESRDKTREADEVLLVGKTKTDESDLKLGPTYLDYDLDNKETNMKPMDGTLSLENGIEGKVTLNHSGGGLPRTLSLQIAAQIGEEKISSETSAVLSPNSWYANLDFHKGGENVQLNCQVRGK